MTCPRAGPVPLAALLDRLAAEAEALAAVTLRAEAALHDLTRHSPPPAGSGQDLQGLDLVRQSLVDMGRLLAMAAAAAPEAAVPADRLFATARLHSLAARLAGASVAGPAAGSGLELF